MAFDKLTAVQLAAADENGVINEDVLQKINIDNENVKLKLTDLCDTGTHSKSFAEWTIDTVKDSDPTIALEDGADISDNNSGYGVRVGNHTQTMGGRVVVSYEAEENDSIGRASELGYQIAMYMKFLERSRNQQLYGNTASVASADGVAPISAGLEAQITAEDLVRGDINTSPTWTSTKLGTSDCVVQQVNSAGTITGGGLDNFSSGIIPKWTYSGVTAGALTETALRDVCQAIWQNTGEETITLHGLNRGAVNRKWSEYSFTSTARVAGAINNTSNGDGSDNIEGKGASSTFISDFGVIEFKPEKEMPIADSGSSSDTLFLVQPGYPKLSTMWGYRGERQGKTGLSEKWQVSCAHSLQLTSPGRCGMVQGIDATAAMTYS